MLFSSVESLVYVFKKGYEYTLALLQMFGQLVYYPGVFAMRSPGAYPHASQPITQPALECASGTLRFLLKNNFIIKVSQLCGPWTTAHKKIIRKALFMLSALILVINIFNVFTFCVCIECVTD